MIKLAPIELEDGTIIYMQVQENIDLESNPIPATETTREITRDMLGKSDKGLADILNK